MPKHTAPRPRSHSLASYLKERLSVKRTYALYDPFLKKQQQSTMDLVDSKEVFDVNRFADILTIDTALSKKKQSVDKDF